MKLTYCNILMIGCGVTALSIARELVARGFDDILVIEKESRPGVHASGRNSGVLHSGIYYTPGSLKARFCAEGNRLLSKYCITRGLSFNRSGKVIVARDESEYERLLNLKTRADCNDVECELIDKNELRQLEPYAFTYKHAIYSPRTAVFNPVEVLEEMRGELEATGKVKFKFKTEFLHKKSTKRIETSDGAISYNLLINCAGAFAEKISQTFGVGMKYRVLPFIGTYQRINTSHSYLVNSNIYPVPDLRNPFLGVHFTRTIDGSVYIGPTAIPAPGRESYGILKGITSESAFILYRDIVMLIRSRPFRDNAKREIKKYFSRYVFNEARKMVPSLQKSYMQNSGKVGIRPQLVDWEEKKLADDFVVLNDEFGNVHVLNAISPAFTSSMSFARYVTDSFITGK